MAARNPSCGCKVREVRFSIVSAVDYVALVKVEAWDAGYSMDDIPEIDPLIDGHRIGILEVCDPSGCFLNEPNVKLTSRQGWARYMEVFETGLYPVDDKAATACRPVNYGVKKKYAWEIFALCCNTLSCATL